MIDHAGLQQLAAGAVLGDLDADERRVLDRHLSECLPCTRLAMDLRVVAGDLAASAPARRPPPHLLADVVGAIRASDTGPALRAPVPLRSMRGDVVEPATGAGPRPSPRVLSLALAAALVVAVGGLGAVTVGLANELSAERAAREQVGDRLELQAGAMLAALHPAHVTASLHAEPVAPAASAIVIFVPGTRDAYLVARGLPATPKDHVYQLWMADEDGVHGLGTFSHDGGATFVAPFGVDMAGAAAAMVTLEPAGGAVGEPGPEVVFGEL